MTQDLLAPLHDPARLAALRQAALLDSPTEEAFDRLTRLAVRLLQVPVALVSLVDEQRQFFKSCVGLAEPWASQRETPLSHSFCQYPVAARAPLIITDARTHPLVHDNLAIPDLNVVAYAGMPLITADGHALGAFCAIDTTPRVWTDSEIALLHDLTDMVMTEIELRSEIRVRTQVAEALRAQVGFTRAIASSLGEGVYALDRAGHVTFLNPAAEQLLGWTEADLLGTPLHQLLPMPPAAGSTETTAAGSLLGALHAGTSTSSEEAVLLHKDGTRVPVAYTCAPIITAGDTTGAVLAFRDITARKRAAEQLHFQAHLLDVVDQAVIAVDVDETIMYWNRFAETLYGWTASEAIGHSARMLTAAGVPAAQVAEIIACLRAGASWSGEFLMQHRDGTTFPVLVTDSPIYDATGALIGMVGVSQDITARKRAEETLHQAKAELERRVQERTAELHTTNQTLQAELTARTRAQADLEETQRRLAALLSNLPGMAYRCRNDPTWTLEFASAGAFPLTGYHSADLIANTKVAYGQLIHPDDQAAVWAAVQDAVRTQQPFQLVYRITTAAGEAKWVWEQGQGVCSAAGEMIALEGFVMDITARKQAEAALADERATLVRRVDERTAALRLANQELARSARLKDEFLANMSHELRTPLNAVLGLAEALQEQVYGPLNERQRGALHHIEESGRHLLSLITDILDLSKIEAGKLELIRGPLAVEPLCQASLRLITQQAQQKALTVAASYDPRVTQIEGDARRLKQVLVNLLSNAVKFTPPGGRIGLDVVGDAGHEAVTFTVWDTGIGIAQEDLPRLFQPFMQVDSSLARTYAGTGLGLALVRRMVELHGGTVALASAVGQGSRVTVTLPWNVPAPVSEPGMPAPSGVPGSLHQASPAPRQGTRAQERAPLPPVLLLVEDNPTSIEMCSAYLQDKGYHIVVARSGVEALARARAVRPAAILLDIQLPELDGLAVLRRMRAEADLQAIPIIALTALAMDGDRERCLAAGATGYLSKPVTLRELVAVLEAHLPAQQH